MGHGMTKILPGIYLGSLRDVKSEKQMKGYKITHVLSLIPDFDFKGSETVTYKNIEVSDNASDDIKQHFEDAIDFVHESRMLGGNVLIHCMAGVSRSTTILIAYMITLTDINWESILCCIRAVRDVANPNPGFRKQLQEYQQGELVKKVRKKIEKTYISNPFSDKTDLLQLLIAKKERQPKDIFVLYRYGSKAYTITENDYKILERNNITIDDMINQTSTNLEDNNTGNIATENTRKLNRRGSDHKVRSSSIVIDYKETKTKAVAVKLVLNQNENISTKNSNDYTKYSNSTKDKHCNKTISKPSISKNSTKFSNNAKTKIPEKEIYKHFSKISEKGKVDTKYSNNNQK